MSKNLSDYTTADLFAEISRRANSTDEREYCDDCARFRPMNTAGIKELENYNPCDKGHAMSFQAPRDYQSPDCAEWGFYRVCCPDRVEVQA